MQRSGGLLSSGGDGLADIYRAACSAWETSMAGREVVFRRHAVKTGRSMAQPPLKLGENRSLSNR